MSNEVSKAIMFYYDSQNDSYKPIGELSDAENIYKYIPKVELYWFDESTNSYKPLVTDGKLPISGSSGSNFDPAILNDYAKKTYVNTEIGKIDLSNYDTHIEDNVKHITEDERMKWNTVGIISELDTTNKTDLVKAINEVKSHSKSPYITKKNVLGFGKEFVFWFGDSVTVSNTYDLSIPTSVAQDTAVQLQGLSLVPSVLNRLYVRFYIADKTKLSKISVKASNGLSSEFQRFTLSNGWNEVPLNFNLGTATEGNITHLQFQVRGLNTGDNAGIILNSVGVIDRDNIATVSLQFDDALSSVYTEARKILRDNNMVASIGVISSFVGNVGHMTEAQLKEMKMMGWSLFNHTASHTNMGAYTKEQAILEVETAKNYLDTTYGTGIESSYVAYPQGAFNDNVKLALQEKGMVGRGLSARDELLPNPNKQDTCAFEINNVTTLEQAKAQIDLAIKHGSHITLLLHKVETTAGSSISTTITLLRSLVEYIRLQEDSKMIRVITTTDIAKLELEG